MSGYEWPLATDARARRGRADCDGSLISATPRRMPLALQGTDSWKLLIKLRAARVWLSEHWRSQLTPNLRFDFYCRGLSNLSSALLIWLPAAF